MPEQRYRITITLKAEDLIRENGEDKGSEAIITNNEVSAETRHAIERQLSELMLAWGDRYAAKKSGAS